MKVNSKEAKNFKTKKSYSLRKMPTQLPLMTPSPAF